MATKTIPPDPIDKLLNLGEMQAAFNRLAHAMDCEKDGIAEQWESLGRAGGQRADLAADLLGALEPHLRGLAEFCSICRDQIIAMRANPFQRNDGEIPQCLTG